MSDTTQTMPNAPEVEMAILCSFFRDVHTVAGLCAERGVTSEHFWAPSRATIFDTMMEMWNERKDVDIATLSETLDSRGQLELVGGMNLLTDLSGYNASAFAGHYIDVLDEKLRRRQRIRVCWDAAQKNFDETEDGAGLQAELEQSVLAIGERHSRDELSFSQHIDNSLTRLQDRITRGTGMSGLSTGIGALDEMTGGLADGDYIVIAAETSGGKTALAMRFLEAAAVDAGQPAAAFSYEMSNAELTDRMMSSYSRVNLHDFRKGTIAEGALSNIERCVPRLKPARIFLRDESDLNVMQVRAIARRLKRRHNIRLVVVDYAQLIPSLGKKGQNREQEIAEISRNLKGMAKELSLPVVALSQLNDDGKIRESRAISHDANLLLIIQEEQDQSGPTRHFIRIAKQRNGPRDRVPVTFQKEYTRFEDSPDYQPPHPQRHLRDI